MEIDISTSTECVFLDQHTGTGKDISMGNSQEVGKLLYNVKDSYWKSAFFYLGLEHPTLPNKIGFFFSVLSLG
jgi:hypothetical protein